MFNSAVILDRTGRIALKHRKIDTLLWLPRHLYDRGKLADIRTIDTESGRIGLTICADNFNLKHPQEVADQGAWLLIAPHGFAAEESQLEQNSRDYQAHIRDMMLGSRETFLNYTIPLGLPHLIGGDHCTPQPWNNRAPRANWTATYYHQASEDDIGFDRTKHGDRAVEQYFPAVCDQFNDLKSCPEKYLLWFHVVRGITG